MLRTIKDNTVFRRVVVVLRIDQINTFIQIVYDMENSVLCMVVTKMWRKVIYIVFIIYSNRLDEIRLFVDININMEFEAVFFEFIEKAGKSTTFFTCLEI